jgi:ABC-type nitrate/sulfonate/bicarbonate transport system substrate-binding protein
MRRLLRHLLILLLPFLFLSCSTSEERNAARPLIKIAVNPWVGYTPFMYLERTGELEKLGFKMVLVSSLGENANLLSNHLVDGFAATQYEFINYKDELDGIVPVFTVDRSAGADKVHSNVDIRTLETTDKPIHVFMEFGSCNEDLFKSFVKAYGLEGKKFVYHHDPQSVIKNLRNDPEMVVVVVSYEPFSSTLQKNGIEEVASSKTLDILIVDALFAARKDVTARRESFLALKRAFWQAKSVLDKDPKRFYETVKGLLEGQDYEAFLKSLEGIEWLPEPDRRILQRLKEQGIDTSYLL